MKKIEAKIIADSINPQGDRITTYLLTFPRFILAELNTHRVFSKNSASSRAIPFEKMVKMVEEDPFIPIAWQKSHKGMQGSEYFLSENGDNTHKISEGWLLARDSAVQIARGLNNSGVTKQLCNRLLEPFMWHTVLLTATEFENFFNLRCPQYVIEGINGNHPFRSKKDVYKRMSSNENFMLKLNDFTDLDWLSFNKSQAEIHMQALAEAMWDAYNESTPKELKAGEWHFPFGDKMQDRDIMQCIKGKFNSRTEVEEAIQKFKLKVSTARCARLSYMTFDGKVDYEKDIKLYDSLLSSHHASPFEHVSRCLTEEEYNALGKMILDPVKGYIFEKGWVDNFKGFVSYRRILNF